MMIVLGADTHKRSHTIAAVAAGTGGLRGERPWGWALAAFRTYCCGRVVLARAGVGAGGLPTRRGLV